MRMSVCVAVVVVAAGLIGAVGCEKKAGDKSGAGAPAGAGDTKPKEAPGGQRHVVRGQIDEMPEAGNPNRPYPKIHHEAIPGWVYADGRAGGMASMSMHFPPKDGVSLEGIAAGDIVEFEVEQVNGAKPPWVMTRISKLPAETKLDFGGKKAEKK